MAINPELSLAVRTPQVENPLEQAGKALSIVGMRQQQQIGQENLKSHQLANQEAILKQKDDQAIAQSWQQAGGDYKKHIQLAGQLGARPQAVQGLEQHYNGLIEQQGKIDKDKREKQAFVDSHLAAITNQLLDTPDDQYGAAYAAVRPTAQSIAQTAYPDLQLPEQPIPKNDLQHFRLGFLTDATLKQEADARNAAAEEKRKAEKQPYELQKLQSEATSQETKTADEIRAENATRLAAAAKQGQPALQAELQRVSEAGGAEPFMGVNEKSTPGEILRMGMKPHEVAAADTAEKNAENNVTELELRLRAKGGDQKAAAALKDFEDSKVRVAKVEAQNKWDLQMGALAAAANGEPSAGVQMVADYQIPLNQLLSRTPPAARNMILDQVKKVNPSFQESQYAVAQKTEQDSVTGKIGTTSNAQNTALTHMGTLYEAALALKNGDIQILNRLANAWGVQTGKTAKTTYDAIVHKVGPELASAYIAGGGAVGERGATEKDFDSSMGADQILKNIGISAELLKGKIKANQQQYERGTYGRGKQKLLSDEAQATLDRLSGLGKGALSTGHKVDDIVMVRGKKYRITKVLPDDKFEGDEVKE